MRVLVFAVLLSGIVAGSAFAAGESSRTTRRAFEHATALTYYINSSIF